MRQNSPFFFLFPVHYFSRCKCINVMQNIIALKFMTFALILWMLNALLRINVSILNFLTFDMEIYVSPRVSHRIMYLMPMLTHLDDENFPSTRSEICFHKEWRYHVILMFINKISWHLLIFYINTFLDVFTQIFAKTWVDVSRSPRWNLSSCYNRNFCE